MPIGSPQWMYASGEDFTIDQSLRHNDGKVPVLIRDFPSAGNQKTFTMSAWIKPSMQAAYNALIDCYVDDNNWTMLGSLDTGEAPGRMKVLYQRVGNTSTPIVITTQVFRDSSAWYHIVIAIDTTQATASNRVKAYVNGELITSFTTATYPSQNADIAWINSAMEHRLMAQHTGSASGDGYLAEFHFIDGTALTPASFGETGDYGEWKPIEVEELTYGTNGFYLNFNQDYTVEGFSAITYKGTGVNSTYYGGVGFQPDLVFIKGRSSGESSISDSVRGVGYSLFAEGTGANDGGGNLVSFNPDGFTTSDSNRANQSGRTIVAWNWDMGPNYGNTITAVGNAKISTTQEKFGNSSAYFDGSGDYLKIPGTHGDFDILASASSNYTLECWVYHTDSIGGDRVYMSQTEGSYQNSWYFRAVGGAGLTFTAWSGGSNIVGFQTSSGLLSQNTWHHVALVKTGTNYKIFVDGTSATLNTTSDTSTWNSHNAPLRIGDNGSGQYMVGYIDEIRISDTARYSSNFTPSTSAFTRDDNTKLLMHFEGINNSQMFLDNLGSTLNTDGTITSNVKANTTYGQSIVSYVGNQTSGATVGHGLSSAPEMIIIKNTSQTSPWAVYHTSLTDVQYLRLNETAAAYTSSTRFNSTNPSSTVFTLGNDSSVNGDTSSDNLIAYCWHSVAGYSSFGTYDGDNTTDGSHTINVGFTPAFVMIKCTNDAESWNIWDNVRNVGIPSGTNKRTAANSSAAEVTNVSTGADYIEFTSTGWKFLGLGGGANSNASSQKYIYMAFADNREYAYWLDQSGNNNDFTSNNFTESDISLDSPTNNFCTLNDLGWQWSKRSGTMSEGNLRCWDSSADWTHANGTMIIPKDKKIYYEVRGVNGKIYAGIALADENAGAYNAGSRPDGGWIKGLVSGYTDSNTAFTVFRTNTGGSGLGNQNFGGSGFHNAVVGVAIDQANSNVKFYIDNVLMTSQGANGNTNGCFDSGKDYVPIFAGYGSGVQTVNFGQDSSFAGAVTAQGNQDSNGIGDFYYEPPTGYLALCTKNLSAVAVTPSEHFNAVTYTGNGTGGASAQTVTGTGFQPDFTWLKAREDGTAGHILTDIVRGTGQSIHSNNEAAQNSNSTAGHLSSWNSNGFVLYGGSRVNDNNEGHIAWNWKASGSTSAGSNLSGVGSCTQSVNQDAGFSMVKWTSTQGGPISYGHGLSKAPEMIISKSIGDTDYWSVGHDAMGWTKQMQLNVTSGQSTTSSPWNNTAPTSTIVYKGGGVNNGQTYINYHFHSVDGYSKVGSYKGNGSSDGTFVHTGFRPAFVLIKAYTTSEPWSIRDSARSPGNLANLVLKPDNSASELTNGFSVDLLSNGFKCRQGGAEINDSSHSYIYLAFAETPFKYSNAR